MKRQIFIVVLLLLLSTCAIPQDLGDIPPGRRMRRGNPARINGAVELIAHPVCPRGYQLKWVRTQELS